MINIATRGSDLALWQARFLQTELAKLGFESQLNIIETKGDKIQDLSFDKIEGKGFFTKEIEDSLLAKESHIAVHSMKDLPTEIHPELTIAAVSDRANPHDCLILNKQLDNVHDISDHLKKGAVIGTSSARRKVQLLSLFPEVTVKDIRGNVPTRIEKLKTGEFDGIILAKAGIERLKLDMSNLTVFEIQSEEMVPAPAQGVLAFQCRTDDAVTIEILAKINKATTEETVSIERKALNLIDGGCQTPFGAFCRRDKQGYWHLQIAYAEDLTSPLKKTKLSQSTNYLLAENALKQL